MRLLSWLAITLVALAASATPTRAGAQLLRGASGAVRSSGSSSSSSSGSSSSASSSRSSSSGGSTLDRSSDAVRSGADGGSSASSSSRSSGPRSRSRDRGSYGTGGYATYDEDGYAAYAAPPVRARLVPAWQPPPAAAGDGSGDASGGGLGVHEREERISVLASADGSYVLGGVGRATASVRVRLPWSLDIGATYAGYFEPNAEGGFDALALGRITLGARFDADDAVEARIAVGLRHFHDWLGGQLGIDGLFGVVARPGEWLELEGEFSIGFVGSAWVAQVRGSVGVVVEHHVVLYAGWDHVALQPFDSALPGVELGGPMAGIRVIAD